MRTRRQRERQRDPLRDWRWYITRNVSRLAFWRMGWDRWVEGDEGEAT